MSKGLSFNFHATFEALTTGVAGAIRPMAKEYLMGLTETEPNRYTLSDVFQSCVRDFLSCPNNNPSVSELDYVYYPFNSKSDEFHIRQQFDEYFDGMYQERVDTMKTVCDNYEKVVDKYLSYYADQIATYTAENQGKNDEEITEFIETLHEIVAKFEEEKRFIIAFRNKVPEFFDAFKHINFPELFEVVKAMQTLYEESRP